MKHKAFTLLELLVSLTLLGVAFTLVVLYAQVAQVRSDLRAQSSTFVSYARLQQSRVNSGQDSEGNGVHLEGNAYVLFTGASYDSMNTSNDTIELPPTLEIQNISLNGGGSDILFSPPHGESTTHGTIEFYSSVVDQTVTITLSPLGNVSY